MNTCLISQRLVLGWVLDCAVFHLVMDALASISTPFLLDLWHTWMEDSGKDQLLQRQRVPNRLITSKFHNDVFNNKSFKMSKYLASQDKNIGLQNESCVCLANPSIHPTSFICRLICSLHCHLTFSFAPVIITMAIRGHHLIKRDTGQNNLLAQPAYTVVHLVKIVRHRFIQDWKEFENAYFNTCKHN